MNDKLIPLLRSLFSELPHPALLEAADRLEHAKAIFEKIGIDGDYRLPLWYLLMTADGNAVEARPGDESELNQLRERGLVRGKKWIRFTEHGLKLRQFLVDN